MYDLLQGIRVVEVAEHTFVPASAMVLADWGADVIKVERATGDASRYLNIPGAQGEAVNLYFEAGNRGKRSIGLDLTKEAGRAQLYKLVEKADVFITNLRRDARKKLGIEPTNLMPRNPRLVYARGTGNGLRGPLADKGGYDYPSSWCQSGSGYIQTPPDGEPPTQPGSVGDLVGGATLAGAIAAALFKRERTGKGTIVDNSLYAVGAYIMSQSLIGASIGVNREYRSRAQSSNALMTNYRTKDNRWLSLCFLETKIWWPDLCRHLDREDMLADPRFVDEAARVKNTAALMAELDKEFAKRTLKEWRTRFKTLAGVWAPLQSSAEVMEDEQAIVNGIVTPVTMENGKSYMVSPSPAQFDEKPIGALKASPGFGQHTDEILREMGLGASEIKSLREAKAVV